MKNSDEPLEDELKERIRNYSKEPGEHLWAGISSEIISVNPDRQWMVWSNRITIVTVVAILILLLYQQHSISGITGEAISIKETQSIETKPAAGKSPAFGEAVVRNPNVISNAGIQRELQGHADVKSVISVRPASSTQVIGDQAGSPFPDSTEAEYSYNARAQAPEDEQFVTNNEFTSIKNAVSDTATAQKTTKPTSGRIVLKADEGVIGKKPARSRLYSLYFTAMPTFGYQRIKPNKDDDVIIQSIQKVSAFSVKRLGIRAELGINYQITPRVNLFTGIFYYRRKQTINYVETQLDSTSVTQESTSGEIVLKPHYGTASRSVEYELRNAGVQIGVNYLLSKGTFLHILGSGVEFQKSLNGSRKQSFRGFSDPTAYVFYNFYYRLQYPSDGKLRAVFQPTLNYSFYINQNLNAPFYVKPYGLGLNFGFTYNF